jgi:hypothetical protein
VKASKKRADFLSLPHAQRSRVASMPNELGSSMSGDEEEEEEYYRLRHFSITGKGVVHNRGDSLKSRRSRSNNSVASSNSSHRWVGVVPKRSTRRRALLSFSPSPRMRRE